MNLIVHISIAYQAYRKFKKKTDMQIVLPFFLIGSILPDLDYHMSKIPHNIQASLPMTLFTAEKISKQSYKNNILEMISKSIQMGIFCHFISDYFCYAHTDRFPESYYQHFAYEYKMIRHIQRAKRYIIHKSAIKIHKSEEIDAFLIRAQILYLSDQREFITDLAHAVNCSSIMSASLANRYLQSCENVFVTGDPITKRSMTVFTTDPATP